MCREKAEITPNSIRPIGSPLRVQGKEFSSCGIYPEFRITPACAGKSRLPVLPSVLFQDHPCVCREKCSKETLLAQLPGSPLRVQGKATAAAADTSTYRITPACAGKSGNRSTERKPCEDHPCVCREKASELGIPLPKKGSPLRVQGKA